MAAPKKRKPIPLTPRKVEFNSKPCDRLTAQFTIYHQHCGEEPHHVSTNFTDVLNTIDQPYARRLQVGAEPVRVGDKNWVTSPGYIVIENRAGMGGQVTPTAEEKALYASQLLSVSFAPGSSPVLVSPRRFCVFELAPGFLDTLSLSSPNGTIPVNITIYPS